MRPPNTHINTHTSIISNGTITNSQPGWNQDHIRTSVSPVQDDVFAEKDTSGYPCISSLVRIVPLNEGRRHGIRNSSDRKDRECLFIV